MNAAVRLGLYAAGLVVVFGVAFATADALVPESLVTSWTDRGEDPHDEQDTTGDHDGR